MLSCKELTELVTDYLEGELSLAESASVYFHLSSCRYCRTYLGQMKSVVKLLRQLPADPGPPEVSDELLLSFRRKHRARRDVQRSPFALQLVQSG